MLDEVIKMDNSEKLAKLALELARIKKEIQEFSETVEIMQLNKKEVPDDMFTSIIEFLKRVQINGFGEWARKK